MNKELESIEESAKAVQEVAKTTSNAIDASREMGGFVSRFVSGPLEQGVGIIEDKLRYVRWERQQRLIKRSEEYIQQQGLSSPNKPLLLKNAVPLLEYATLEEDDYLQDMWARLLVNGTNKSTGINLERSFIEILSQLNSLEVNILEAIYSLPFEDANHEGIITAGLPYEAVIVDKDRKEELEQPSKEVLLSLANLARIGCVRSPLMWGGGELFTLINPTLIGKEFVAACSFQKTI